MSIEKHGNKYRVTVQINGKVYRKSFSTLKEAKVFQRCPSIPTSSIKIIYFREVLELYCEKEAKYHRGAKQDILKIGLALKDRISNIPVNQLTSKDFNDYFLRRLSMKTNRQTLVCEATVKKDRAILHSALEFAIRTGLINENPLTKTMRLKNNPPRERIATDEEILLLRNAVDWAGDTYPSTATQRVVMAFVFSTLTGMRLGEICLLEPSWIHGRVIRLPKEATKTLRKRDVALCSEAIRLLKLILPLGYQKVFGLQRDVASALFSRVRNSVGLGEEKDSRGRVIKEALRFHDGRATFCTRASGKLPPLALAKQLGHTSLAMTMRYYRESADRIADMLD